MATKRQHGWFTKHRGGGLAVAFLVAFAFVVVLVLLLLRPVTNASAAVWEPRPTILDVQVDRAGSAARSSER